MAGKPHPRQRVIQPQDESIRYLPLTQGKVAIVDAEDFERLSENAWYAYWAPNAKTFYAARCIPGDRNKRLKMHREVIGMKSGQQDPDHRNHNGLDNRKRNLRPATAEQNGANRRRFTTSGSRFKGVHKADNGFIARIQQGGKRTYLGYFTDEKVAARAYDEAAQRMHGAFACLNFPDNAT